MKSKLLTALGATGVLRPYIQNPEHILERKILLQNIGGQAAINATPAAICAAGLTFANAWAAQVVTNGGASPSQNTLNAIATLQCGLISNGLDTSMIAWNIIAPDSLIAARTPQLQGGGGVLWTNNNFVAGDLTINGLTGNAANKYLQTAGDLIGAATNGQSVGTFVYSPVVSVAANARAFMVLNGPILGIATKDNTGNSLGANGGNPSDIITTASQGNGFYMDQRITGADHRLFFASSGSPFAQIGATDVNGYVGGLPGAEFYVMALNNGGAPFGFSSETISVVGVTKGLSAANGAIVFNLFDACRRTIGGGFV